MNLISDYFSLRKQLHDYFDYVEDWRILPMEDSRGYYWRIIGGEGRGGSVGYSEDVTLLDTQEGDYYESSIYTQRFLPKWVYRGKDYTMICVDTHCDGNQYLQVFENALERP